MKNLQRRWTKLAWLKRKEEPAEVEEIEPVKEPVKPVFKALKKEIVQPKIKTIVVKELPVQRINSITDKNIIKQYTDEDIDEIRLVTIEEALTEIMSD